MVDVVEVVVVDVEVDVVDDSATTEVLVVEVVDDASGTVVVDASVTAIVVGVTPTVVVEATGISCANVSEQTKSCAALSAARAGATGKIANTATNETSTHSTRVEDAKRVLNWRKMAARTPTK